MVYYILSGTPRSPQKCFWSGLRVEFSGENHLFQDFFFSIAFRPRNHHVKLLKLIQNFSLRFWKFTFFLQKNPKHVFPKNVPNWVFYSIDWFFPNRSSAPREASISQPFLNFSFFPMGRNAILTPDSGRPSKTDKFSCIICIRKFFGFFWQFWAVFQQKCKSHPKYGLWGLKSKEIARAFTSRNKIEGFFTGNTIFLFSWHFLALFGYFRQFWSQTSVW